MDFIVRVDGCLNYEFDKIRNLHNGKIEVTYPDEEIEVYNVEDVEIIRLDDGQTKEEHINIV